MTEGRKSEVNTLREIHQPSERKPADNQTGHGNGAFEDLMRSHCGLLIQSLSLVALDRETAADAAQEAFLELHLHFDEVRNPVPWLYRVAFNRCLDSRRRFARRVRLLERLVGAASPEDWIAPVMAHSDLSEVLVKLPLRQRTAVTLYYLADLSVAEIAAVMNVSEGSVNRHLFRAREALHDTMEADSWEAN